MEHEAEGKTIAGWPNTTYSCGCKNNLAISGWKAGVDIVNEKLEGS